MSNITKEAVMDLREKTGAGLIDCKRALAETNGDLEEAISILRKKGVASAAKKAGREAVRELFPMRSQAIVKRYPSGSELRN